MATFLTVAGVVLQLVGAVVALRGLIKTHDAYADKSIRTLTFELLNRWRGRIVVAVNRLLGRRQHVVVGAGASIGMGGAFRARAIIGWGPLPKRTADALAELARRLGYLKDRIDALDERMADAAEEQTAAMKQLREDLEKAAKDAVEAVRSAAIEGLMGEAIGLGLVILGGLLQAGGALIPAA